MASKFHITQSRYRQQQTQQAMIDKGGKCDRCGKPAEHYHEIISRGRTINLDIVRVMSFGKVICAILCEDCHTGANNAHSPEVATELLQRNIDIYGYSRVKLAFESIVEELPTKSINIKFPERKSD